MKTIAGADSADHERILGFARKLIEDANLGRRQPQQVQALVARMRAAMPAHPADRALAAQIADALEALADQRQAGRLCGRVPSPEAATRPDYTPVYELDQARRRIVETTALEEIAFFGADGDPAAIERLAAQGRLQDGGAGQQGDCAALAWQVSDVMDEIAARMRAGHATLIGTMTNLGPLVRLSVQTRSS